MKLSFTIIKFYFFMKNYLFYINLVGKQAHLNLTNAQLLDIATKFADLEGKLLIYVNPNTHNPGSVGNMNASYKISSKLIDDTNVGIVNSGAALDSTDRMNLGVPEPSTRQSNVLPPGFAPAALCISKSSLMMHMIAFNPLNPFKREKPKGAYSIGMKWVIVPAGGAVPKPEDYILQPSVKNSEFELLFLDGEQGSTLYLICFYLSNRVVAGPDSMPCIVTII